ncbi:hypothetical protein TNCV_2905511 [Trichonephila clavipes]|nr:hypothetical protein TNCV_2905511 [Trichonephila clavipes]
MEGSGRDNQTRQTRATMRGRKAERPVRSNQATTRRPCPYYLRSRVKESDGIPEEQRNIEINGIPHSKIRSRSLSMEALDEDPFVSGPTNMAVASPLLRTNIRTDFKLTYVDTANNASSQRMLKQPHLPPCNVLGACFIAL